ncbi:protein-disulfide reductase DsbD domain-containing protein [Oceanicella actignis]|uniref:protein-disulfide reductase DsbD domain-containing protein n=1 Tax=Oceanicella actignis TaxID=1189325 RepID=UPI0011E642E0|nr:protein-disulfide reductase DsbD domain-containing protein [Oceanicella actignis]TYO89662.1 DsbC/DsbD-like thiol-disulfide interchange protein [Oceanicella actignis]
MARAARLALGLAVAAMAAAAPPPPAARAEQGAPATLRLVPAGRTADGRPMAALLMDLADGWKTYWRAPGEAGVPPRIDWSGSENLARAEALWPRPDAFESFGMLTLGYKHAMTLPLALAPERADHPMRLRMRIDYGVCSDICMPGSAELSLELPAGGAPAPEAVAARLSAALADGPQDAARAGVAMARCALEGAGGERRLTALLRLPAAMRAHAPAVVVEGPEGVWFDPPRVSPAAEGIEIAADAWLDDPALWVARSAVRVTVLAGSGFFELTGCPAS